MPKCGSGAEGDAIPVQLRSTDGVVSLLPLEHARQSPMIAGLLETAGSGVVDVPASAAAVKLVNEWLEATEKSTPSTSDPELYVSLVRLADFLQLDQLYGRLLCSLGGGDSLSLVRACYRGVPNLVALLCSSVCPFADSAQLEALLEAVASESADALSALSYATLDLADGKNYVADPKAASRLAELKRSHDFYGKATPLSTEEQAEAAGLKARLAGDGGGSGGGAFSLGLGQWTAAERARRAAAIAASLAARDAKRAQLGPPLTYDEHEVSLSISCEAARVLDWKLWDAVMAGDLAAAQDAFDAGADADLVRYVNEYPFGEGILQTAWMESHGAALFRYGEVQAAIEVNEAVGDVDAEGEISCETFAEVGGGSASPCTLLLAAAQSPAVIDWLIDHGAHPDHGAPYVTDNDHLQRSEYSPLHAVRTVEAAATLLARGADVNFLCAGFDSMSNDYGVAEEDVTPLLLATRAEDPRLVELLLRYGADVDHRGEGGRDEGRETGGDKVTVSALMIAAAVKPNEEVLRVLLAGGADIELTSGYKEGALDNPDDLPPPQTALELAEQSGHSRALEMAEILRQHAAGTPLAAAGAP